MELDFLVAKQDWWCSPNWKCTFSISRLWNQPCRLCRQ